MEKLGSDPSLVKMVKNIKMLQISYYGFSDPKIFGICFTQYHCQISKNEGNQNFKLSTPAWFLQELALTLSHIILSQGSMY